MKNQLSLTFPPAPAILPPFHQKSTFRKAPFIIGVSGGASSGKGSMAKAIMDALSEAEGDFTSKVKIISMSSFYKELSPSEIEQAKKGEYNFDHPDAFDWKLLGDFLTLLNNGEDVSIPTYDYKEHVRLKETTRIGNPAVIIMKGMLMFYDKKVRETLSLKVFIDVDDDVRLANHVVRYTEIYKKSFDSLLSEYLQFVKPAFEDFILPSKRYSDMIIPKGSENKVAISILSTHIMDMLRDKARGVENQNVALRKGNNRMNVEGLLDGIVLPGNLMK